MPDRLVPGQTAGTAHFLRAEQLLGYAETARNEEDGNMEHHDRLVAVANVHALLALASAQAAPEGRRVLGYGWHDMKNPGAGTLRQL